MQEVDPTLLGGLKVEWGYLDPVNMFSPSMAEDLTLQNVLRKKAMNQGVTWLLTTFLRSYFFFFLFLLTCWIFFIGAFFTQILQKRTMT